MLLDTLSPTERAHVERLASELSQYGLGIFLPHSHNKKGEITQLDAGTVAYEVAGCVSFLPYVHVPSDAVEVGWRWENNELKAVASCCGQGTISAIGA